MSSSPFLSQDLKDYIKTHKLEETLSNLINEALANKFNDPFAFFISKLEHQTKTEINITGMQAFETFNSRFEPTISLKFTIRANMKDHAFFSKVNFPMSSDQVNNILL